MKRYDAVVIGGGPAGITAALYLCRAGVSVALVEMLAPGGQVLKTESIENYPGFPKGIKGWELADVFAEHLNEFSPDRYNDAVTRMDRIPEGWKLTVGKDEVTARSVILCSGANPRQLGIPREKELTGRGVSYCALCDGNFFRNQIVAVVGGRQRGTGRSPVPFAHCEQGLSDSSPGRLPGCEGVSGQGTCRFRPHRAGIEFRSDRS